MAKSWRGAKTGGGWGLFKVCCCCFQTLSSSHGRWLWRQAQALANGLAFIAPDSPLRVAHRCVVSRLILASLTPTVPPVSV